MHLNIEIKARCADPGRIRNYLLHSGADFKGVDEQTDTYFHVPAGRLKLRQGNIENNLIFYERTDQPGPKRSAFNLVSVQDPAAMLQLLTQSLGVKVVVQKRREIYYIGNVKFHIDEVPGLGYFVEIEAGNLLAEKTPEELQEQCDHYCKVFSIREEDLVAGSYSNMLEQEPMEEGGSE